MFIPYFNKNDYHVIGSFISILTRELYYEITKFDELPFNVTVSEYDYPKTSPKNSYKVSDLQLNYSNSSAKASIINVIDLNSEFIGEADRGFYLAFGSLKNYFYKEFFKLFKNYNFKKVSEDKYVHEYTDKEPFVIAVYLKEEDGVVYYYFRQLVKGD